MEHMKYVILDEADQMLEDLFADQIKAILNSKFPPTTSLALFSATMPQNVLEIAENYLNQPVRILLPQDEVTLEGIKQYYVALDNDDTKYETLKDIYSSIAVSQSIIYCNSVKRVHDLYVAMNTDNYPVCQIHSSMEKSDRDKSFNGFRNGSSRVLISSNVTSRGIDVQQVRTVLNFDLPKCIFNYLHRIGRSGRWGRKGTAINFVTRWDIKTMKEIERHYHTIVDELPSNIVID